MENGRVVIGAWTLAFLALAIPAIAYTTDPPTAALVLLVVLGVATLVAVGLWAGDRSPRTALRLATASAVITALLAIPPVLLPTVSTVARVFLVLLIVVTIVAVALVSIDVGRRPGAGRVRAGRARARRR